MSMDVIGTTAFGVELGAQAQGTGNDLVRSAEAMFQPMGSLPFYAALLSFAVPALR
jgi:thromboxane-A synthase